MKIESKRLILRNWRNENDYFPDNEKLIRMQMKLGYKD